MLSQILPKQDMNHIQLFNTVIAYMQKEKIERISDGYIRRIISSAKQQYESSMFQRIYDSLNSETKGYLDGLMINENQTSRFALMKRWPRGLSLETILGEADKLRFFRLLALPTYLEEIPNKQLLRHYRNISTKYPSAIKLMPETHKYALLAIFAIVRTRQLTDNLVELLIRITHKVVTKGENKLKHELSQVFEIKGNCNSKELLYKLATTILEHKDEIIKEAISPVVSEERLEAIKDKNKGGTPSYIEIVHERVRNSYVHHYRRMLAPVLELLSFQSNNTQYQPIIEALQVIPFPYFN